MLPGPICAVHAFKSMNELDVAVRINSYVSIPFLLMDFTERSCDIFVSFDIFVFVTGGFVHAFVLVRWVY